MQCDNCLYFDLCGGDSACEFFSPAYEDDTYAEIDLEVYREYCEDYLNYLKEFNR